MQHYAQLTEADMKEAAEMTVLGEAEKTVHNPVHTPVDSPCTDLNESTSSVDVNPDNCNSLQLNSTPCKSTQNPTYYARRDSNPRPFD